MDKYFAKISVASLLAVCLAFAGCGKTGGQKIADNAKIFEPASPEVKAAWEKIQTATTNDCVTAILGCRKLQAQSELTAEQRALVIDTLSAVNARMTNAAQHGDANALKAIEEIRARWRSN
jgi:hypothetical protein